MSLNVFVVESAVASDILEASFVNETSVHKDQTIYYVAHRSGVPFTVVFDALSEQAVIIARSGAGSILSPKDSA